MTQNNQILLILNDAQKLRKVAEATFNGLDIDGSGYIDVSELETLMKKVASDIGAPSPSEGEIQDILKALDTNNDDKISLNELCVLIKQVLEVIALQ